MDRKYGDVESSDDDLDITHVVGKELVRDASSRITGESDVYSLISNALTQLRHGRETSWILYSG